MTPSDFRVAIVGCGNIARTYASQISGFEGMTILGFQDLDRSRAEAMVAEYGGKVYADLAEVTADAAVDLVVNLTIHTAHYEVIRTCLEAGKHVHTEKPLSMTYTEASELADLAEAKGLRLSSAPVTWMGNAQQLAHKHLLSGVIGEIGLAYAEVNHGRIETWHPNPVPFYAVGVVYDVAVYPLTLLTAFLGPVARVQAMSRYVMKHRVGLDGKPFELPRPEFTVALLDFASGTTGRLSANFFAKSPAMRDSVEFSGTDGNLRLESWFAFDEKVSISKYGKAPHLIESDPNAPKGAELAMGVRELRDALAENRPHRFSSRHAAHVIEIMEAITTSAKDGSPIDLKSTFTPWVG